MESKKRMVQYCLLNKRLTLDMKVFKIVHLGHILVCLLLLWLNTDQTNLRIKGLFKVTICTSPSREARKREQSRNL